MSDERVCVVIVIDAHGVEHKVKVRAESVYEAALLGLNRLERPTRRAAESQTA
jgi:hypothetical protein